MLSLIVMRTLCLKKFGEFGHKYLYLIWDFQQVPDVPITLYGPAQPAIPIFFCQELPKLFFNCKWCIWYFYTKKCWKKISPDLPLWFFALLATPFFLSLTLHGVLQLKFGGFTPMSHTSFFMIFVAGCNSNTLMHDLPDFAWPVWMIFCMII